MPLTRLLNAFLDNFIAATGTLTPVAWGILTFLLAIELLWIGAWYFHDHELNPRPLVMKVVTVNILGWFILNWQWFAKQFMQMWIAWGLSASHGVMKITDFTDPDNIARFGFAVTGVIWRHLSTYTAWEQIKNLLEIWISGAAAFVVIIFYFGLGAWSMVTILEFYYSSVVTLILLPWGVSGIFAWIAEKAIGHMVASGIRLFVLAFLLSIALPIMETINMTVPKNLDIPLVGPSFFQAMYALCGALGLGMLCWRAGAFAMGFSYGGPQLSPRDVTSFVNMMTTQVTRLGETLDTISEKLGLGETTPGRRI